MDLNNKTLLITGGGTGMTYAKQLRVMGRLAPGFIEAQLAKS